LSNRMTKIDGDYKNLEFLTLIEVLNDNPQDKLLTLLAKDDSEQKAVVMLSKKPFQADKSQQMISKCELKLDLKNDCYHTFDGFLPSEFQPIRYSVTYPASEHHIAKARATPREIWFETAEMFQKIHQPFIDIQKGHLGWVYNILEKNREKCNEVDRILYEDTDRDNGFMILPDLKWDQKDTRALDLLLLVNRRDLHTVRDLNTSHIPLLENIASSVSKIVSKKFSISDKELRLFFHYPPSHYHLHLHITSTSVSVGCLTERAILLQDVIENIQLMPDYYRKRTLPLSMHQGQKLHTLMSKSSE